MSAIILTWSIWFAQIAIAIAMCLVTWRIAVGPRAQDRILALESLYVCGMLQLVAFGIRTGNTLFFEASLVIGVMGFVATVALAKFLMRGEVIE